ncbi:unnamed protein product [Rotaria socialis]|uniref:EGF-like domain-containing protein n=2 Tax=Rotaria socialis TaxID=392032 RepID=A0A821EP51_9BILA|nr:unnamed protein product [Rotaria socialis]
MYNTGNHHDRFCLSYFQYNKEGANRHIIANLHLKISYCLRVSKDYDSLDLTNIYHALFTFLELKSKNISSSTLLFHDLNSNPLVDDKLLSYNCISPWLGPFCRFTFDYNIDETFNDIIRWIFVSKGIIYQDIKVACYQSQHLKCDTLISCLDWRDICDRKHDRFDGSDEKHGWKLEINHCAEDEYRCHNGQYIPVEFLQDSAIQYECLNKTDESFIPGYQKECHGQFNFQCEEHMCRPGIVQFSCGDGQCTNGIIRRDNGRSSLLLPDLCSNVTACSMITMGFVDRKWCKKFCPKLMWLDNTRSYENLEEIVNAVREKFRARLVIVDENNYCNCSTVYQCQNSKKCISKSRLLDDLVACPIGDDEPWNQSCSLSDRNHRFKCYDEDHDKCFALLVYQDPKKNCKYVEDERGEFGTTPSEININMLFQNICDGKQDFPSILIDGHYETDETDCQVWPLNCPPSTCPSLEHSCVFPNDTSKISCLPITRVGDNISDCLGTTDARKYFCQFVTTLKRHKFMHFKLSNLPTYPTLLMSHDTSNLSPDRAEPRLVKENRPKNVSKNYSVQIYAYNQMTLNYRASWIFSIKFPFLPVYHPAAVLKVPFDNVQPIQTCRSPYIHGQCFNYINNPNSTLCRCHAGCDSICLCRLGRFGARCYLRHTLCDSNPCLNNRQCLPWDPSLGTGSQKNAICICPPGYMGAHCENLLRTNSHRCIVPSKNSDSTIDTPSFDYFSTWKHWS